MRDLRSLITHPVALVPFSILAGLALHGWMNPGPTTKPEPPHSLISANPALISTDPGVEPAARAPAEEPKPPAPPPVDQLPAVSFQEVWGYLMPGEEERWRPEARLTDVALFSHRLDEIGQLTGKLPEKTLKLAQSRGARAHLVVASSGQRSLLHFLLEPRYGLRQQWIEDLAELARQERGHPVAGFQLDLEGLRSQDRSNFLSFLRELRAALPERLIFSLALPARTAAGSNDAYPYRELAPLADRFFIMTYDEHWRDGPPGSISSKEWHDRVARHALSELPREKVVVGLPFYGRIWQLEPVARAIRHEDLGKILDQPEAKVQYDAAATHRFTFQKTVTAQGWFDDAASLHAKFSSAKALGAQAVGFWRLGQEDPRVWGLLGLPAK
ncbi:MAG: hypothetical protein HY717_18845 [Planctomycetes bacterium]|nr:hypothetical protein [Planctomycetota bacterium]